MNAFGEFLRELKPAHVTWAALASQVGISRTQMSLLVNGAHRPAPRTIERLARVLDADVDRLRIAAGHVPDDLLRIIARDPDGARRALKAMEGAAKAAGPALVTEETRSEDLKWKTKIRKPLVKRLREEFGEAFSAPWNTARHQVLVLPGYRIYNAKFFYARFPPHTDEVRFGFWVEKGIVGRAANPEWQMKRSWDWHALIDALATGRIGVKDLGLDQGLVAFAGRWGPEDVRWYIKGRKLRREDKAGLKTVPFEDITNTLATWPEDEWCDFIVSTAMPTEHVDDNEGGAMDTMMETYGALFSLLRCTAAHFRE